MPSNVPKRIGVVVAPWRGLNEAALRFLVLTMNSGQSLFQFEFYSPKPGDPLMAELNRSDVVGRASVRELLPAFTDRLRDHLEHVSQGHELTEAPPDRFVVISRCRFDDNFYSTRRAPGSVIALGNWKRFMAPPSLLEFIRALLIREAVATLVPALSGSVHLGNKGCLMDFTHGLWETRQKVLCGYVCHYCRTHMESCGQSELADIVTNLLARQALGSPSDPTSPAGVTAKLGYHLFIARGSHATPWEAFITALQQEGVKQTATVAGVVLTALILYMLGLQSR